ncbi:MAG: DNA-binding protein WhiA [Mycoplasma sp.]|nr:DNA-binding protein WhiA [Candidatus Hennigella equi]
MRKETFSEKVKKEICSLIFEDHCLKALLSSFISNRLTVVLKANEFTWRLTSQFPFIVEFLANAFKNLYDVKVNTTLAKNATNINGQTNYIEVTGNFEQIENDLCLNGKGNIDELCQLQCCKRAYIAGAFLAGGSINSLESKSYHLEIRSSNWEYLFYQQKMLISFGIYPVLTKHSKKQYILYLKKVNQISDFLKLINAGNCMLAFEDNKISKDASMSITRWNNLDISNINKSTQTGVKQIKQIKKLQTSILWKKQSKKFKAFCQLRLDNPSSSLSELVGLMQEQYNIKTTKPGLNHLARKLDKLSKE